MSLSKNIHYQSLPKQQQLIIAQEVELPQEQSGHDFLALLDRGMIV